MEKGTCIITGQEGAGYPVRDDIVIRTLRRIKRLFGIAKNNRLIVSADELFEYKKRRAKFEKNFVQYAALALLIFAAMVILSISTGTISLGTLVMPILIGVLLLLLSLVSYVPSIEGAPQDEVQKPAAPGQEGGAGASLLGLISSKARGALDSAKKRVAPSSQKTSMAGKKRARKNR